MINLSLENTILNGGYMDKENTIHILMSTYNGQDYLEEQLESICNQSIQNWVLYICDDCSVDNTLEIAERYAQKHTNKIFVMKNDKNIGAKRTFARLVREVREAGDYAFCDQDDIWCENKLELMQKRLRIEEENKNEPLLIYSDASLVDANGVVIGESLVCSSGLYLPQRNVFEYLLSCNVVQGAAMFWNEKLHQIVRDIPKQALMHDWWVAMAAAGNGKIIFMPEKLSMYRQHTDNVTGVFDRKKWHRSFLEKISIRNWKKLIENNHMLQKERVSQAQAYVKQYGDSRAAEYVSIMEKNRIARTYLGIKKGYLFMSWKYSLKYYLF